MSRAYSTNGDKRNAYRILVGKPEGKRPLGRTRHRWDDIQCLIAVVLTIAAITQTIPAVRDCHDRVVYTCTSCSVGSRFISRPGTNNSD
jgi:hypothetical protein